MENVEDMAEFLPACESRPIAVSQHDLTNAGVTTIAMDIEISEDTLYKVVRDAGA